jgi:hypothetical protein
MDPAVLRRREMEGLGGGSFRLPPGTAGSSSFYLPEAEGAGAQGRNGLGGPPPLRIGRLRRLLFSPAAGDGGVQCGFRRRVGGTMKGAVAGLRPLCLGRLCASWTTTACLCRISSIRQSLRQSSRQSFGTSLAAGARLLSKSPTRSNWPAKPARGPTEP